MSRKIIKLKFKRDKEPCYVNEEYRIKKSELPKFEMTPADFIMSDSDIQSLQYRMVTMHRDDLEYMAIVELSGYDDYAERAVISYREF